jgi:hypothetical protein
MVYYMQSTRVQTEYTMSAIERVRSEVRKYRRYCLACAAASITVLIAYAIVTPFAVREHGRAPIWLLATLGVPIGLFVSTFVSFFTWQGCEDVETGYEYQLKVIDQAEKCHEATHDTSGWCLEVHRHTIGSVLPNQFGPPVHLTGSKLHYKLWCVKLPGPDTPGEWKTVWHTTDHIPD